MPRRISLTKNKNQRDGSERRVVVRSIGLAGLMIYRRLKYGSAEAVEWIDKLYQFVPVTAYEGLRGIGSRKRRV